MAKTDPMKMFGMFALFVGGFVLIGWGLDATGLVDVFPDPVEQQQVAETTSQALEVIAEQANCPDNLQTSLIYDLKNEENSERDDTFDATGYLYKVQNGVEQYDSSITDTTSGTDTLTCNQKYRLRFVRADADEGDNSKISRVIAPTDGSAVLVDGGKAVEFTPSGQSYTLKLAGERHGVLQFKVFWNDDNGFACDSDDSCTAWETDGTTFESTTNGTAKSIAATDEVDITLHYRSTKANTSFDDFGYYILLEGGANAATVWDDPQTAAVNGKKLSEFTLVGDEAKQFSGYEYVYKVMDHDIDDSTNKFDLVWSPNSGQNPTADVEIDFAAIGGFLSVDGSTILYAAADDTSASAVVYTVQDVTLDLS